jgi:hypothetical protein
MTVPAYVRIMLLEVLEEVRRHPEHDIPGYRRMELYQSFGPSINLSGAPYKRLISSSRFDISDQHRNYGSLAVSTASYVLPIWDKSVSHILATDDTIPADLLHNILLVSKGVLYQDVDPYEASIMLNHDFYHTLGSISFGVGYKVWGVANAAYNALRMVLGVSPLEDKDDAAVIAAKSYAAIEGTPEEGETGSPGIEPVQFDAQKRLEFWEWWLAEAIPAAWEQAKE